MKKDKLSLCNSFVRASLRNRFTEAFVIGDAEITLYNAREVLKELGFSPSKIDAKLCNTMASILEEFGFNKCTKSSKWYLPFKNLNYDKGRLELITRSLHQNDNHKNEDFLEAKFDRRRWYSIIKTSVGLPNEIAISILRILRERNKRQPKSKLIRISYIYLQKKLAKDDKCHLTSQTIRTNLIILKRLNLFEELLEYNDKFFIRLNFNKLNSYHHSYKTL